MTSRLLTCSLLEWLQRSWMHSNVFQASRQKAKTTMNWLQHVPFRKLSWKWRLSDKVIMGSLLNHACVNIYEASKLLIYASTIHPFFSDMLSWGHHDTCILASADELYISDTFFGAILCIRCISVRVCRLYYPLILIWSLWNQPLKSYGALKSVGPWGFLRLPTSSQVIVRSDDITRKHSSYGKSFYINRFQGNPGWFVFQAIHYSQSKSFLTFCLKLLSPVSGFEAFDYGVQIYGYPKGTQWDVVATKWASHTLRSFVQVCIVITGSTAKKKQTDT